MRTYLNNLLEEIDAPSPVAPCQSFQERMNLDEPKPVTAGVLSDEHRKILAEPETIDRREFDYLLASGQGMAAAFKASASTSLDGEVVELCKAFGKEPAKPQVRIERDVLDDGDVSVSEFDLATGKLLRAWITKDGEPPPAMRQ
jgi:hypothetical protein